MMEGQIWVKSELGKGSTFHFVVPFTVDSSPLTRIQETDSSLLRNTQVLVIDCNIKNRIFLEQTLTAWQMKVTAFSSSSNGLTALQTAYTMGKPFELVIINHELPYIDGFELVKEINKTFDSLKTTLILLTSAGQRGDSALCRELGISAYLNMPISPSDLLDTLTTLRGTSESEKKSLPLVTRHSLSEKRQLLHILLAEDHSINRKVAVRMLKKRGHTVVSVSNGAEAVAAFEKEKFSLILMDIQMPDMDGFQATKAIREKEKQTGQHILIIAMTAHALPEYKEKCIQAGMDDYVSKPINIDEFYETIEIEGIFPDYGKKHTYSSFRVQTYEVFNKKAALIRLNGDIEFIKELIHMFLQAISEHIKNLEQALKEHNLTHIERQAHAIKGASAHVHADMIKEAASNLEQSAHNDDMKNISFYFEKIKEEFKRFQTCIQRDKFL